MSIKVMIQPTPNPNARKFICSLDVKTEGKVTFKEPEECNHITLALSLFSLANVSQVHFFENIVTVTQNGLSDWAGMEKLVIGVLENLLPDHDPDFKTALEAHRDNLSPQLKQIDDILDRTVRPALQADGGDLQVIEYTDNVLSILYQGACGSCPSSQTMTLQSIQGVLRHEFDPEIEVITV